MTLNIWYDENFAERYKELPSILIQKLTDNSMENLDDVAVANSENKPVTAAKIESRSETFRLPTCNTSEAEIGTDVSAAEQVDTSLRTGIDSYSYTPLKKQNKNNGLVNSAEVETGDISPNGCVGLKENESRNDESPGTEDEDGNTYNFPEKQGENRLNNLENIRYYNPDRREHDDLRSEHPMGKHSGIRSEYQKGNQNMETENKIYTEAQTCNISEAEYSADVSANISALDQVDKALGTGIDSITNTPLKEQNKNWRLVNSTELEKGDISPNRYVGLNENEHRNDESPETENGDDHKFNFLPKQSENRLNNLENIRSYNPHRREHDDGESEPPMAKHSGIRSEYQKDNQNMETGNKIYTEAQNAPPFYDTENKKVPSSVNTSYVFRSDLRAENNYAEEITGLDTYNLSSKKVHVMSNIQPEQTPQKNEETLSTQRFSSTVEKVPIDHTNETSELEENFFKLVMVVFKLTQYAFNTLLSYQLSKLTTKTLPELVNKYQHDIFHKCYPKAPCCLCNGSVKVFKDLNPQQLDLLTDKNGERLPGHTEGDNSNFCCFPAKKSLKPHQLDMILLRFLLINYCDLDDNVTKAINDLMLFRNYILRTTRPEIETDDYNQHRQDILESLKIISNYCHAEEVDFRLEEAEGMRPANDLLQEFLSTRVKENKKRLIDITEAQVNYSLTTYRVVKTRAMRDGMSRLKESGLLVVTGAAGTGKSTCSHYILRNFCEDNKEYKMLLLSSLEELNDLLCIDDKLIFLLDDIFGKSNVTFNENVHASILARIMACISKQNVKVIITLRNTIYEKCVHLFQKDKLFKDQHIDLSSEDYQMTKQERKKCLKSHLEMFRRSIIDLKVGNIETGSFITKDTVAKIADVDINPSIGFPETCYLFASNDKFLSQGVDFFRHPTNRLLHEIDELQGSDSRGSQLKYLCLVSVLLTDGGEMNIYDSNIAITIRDIMKSVYCEQWQCPKLVQITATFKDLCGKFLRQKAYGIYEFQHRIIFEAVLTSYARTNLDIVFERMDFNFIVEMTWPQIVKDYDAKCALHIPEKHYKKLAKRLLHILKSKFQDRKWFFTESICSWPMIRRTEMKFLDILFKIYEESQGKTNVDLYSGDNLQENEPFYLPAAVFEYLVLFDDQKESIMKLLEHFEQLLQKPQYGYTSVIQGACMNAISSSVVKVCQTGMIERLQELWDFGKKHELKLDYTSCLRCAVQNKQLNTFDWVREKAHVDDCKPYVKHACKSGFLEFVQKFCLVAKFDDLTEECLEACVFMKEPIMNWFKANAMEKVDRHKLLLTLSTENQIEAVKWLINNDPTFKQHIHEAAIQADIAGAKEVYNYLSKRH